MSGPNREEGWAPVPTPGGKQLRERLREALVRFIDPDDDTMPDRTITWVPVEAVLDHLIGAISEEQP